MDSFDIATSMDDFTIPIDESGGGGAISIIAGTLGLTFTQGEITDGEKLDFIYDKAAQLGSGTVNVISAVTEDLDIIVTQYDDYLSADGRALTWTNAAGTWAGGDLTGAIITISVKDREGDATIFTSSIFIVLSATDAQVIALELDNQQTGLFSRIGKSYRYQILITKEGARETTINGYLTSKKSLSPPT